MKNDQKNPIYPSTLVSWMLEHINLLFSAEQDKALIMIMHELET